MNAPIIGGGHAGYGVYRCRDGRVALAAVEPRFAHALGRAAGLGASADLWAPGTAAVLGAFFAARSCAEVTQLAAALDLPLHVMPSAVAD